MLNKYELLVIILIITINIGVNVGIFFLIRMLANNAYLQNNILTTNIIFTSIESKMNNIIEEVLLSKNYLDGIRNTTNYNFTNFFNNSITEKTIYLLAPIISYKNLTDFKFDVDIKRFDGTINTDIQSYYIPVVYNYPYNEKIIGYDSASEPIRNNTINIALNTNKSTITDPLYIASTNGFGINIITPLYNNFYGFDTILFASVDMNYLLSLIDSEGSIINIYDITDKKYLPLYKDKNEDYIQNINDISVFTNVINVLNKDWKIIIKRSNRPNYTSAYISVVIYIILFIVIGGISLKIYNIRNIEAKSQKEMNSMISYVNHELRNPLSCIKGLIELSIDDINELNDTASILSNLHTANNSCDLLKHIINDILDISKLNENKLEIKITEIDCVILVKELLRTMKFKIEEIPNVKIITDIEVSTVKTDELRLIQILINLLSNAIKFTKTGSIIISIKNLSKSHIKVPQISQPSHYTIFSITDTGRGIHKQDYNKIFVPYKQIEHIDYIRYGGVGLGLYLCKLLVKRLNGQIGFYSEFGKGSTFWLTIPVN